MHDNLLRALHIIRYYYRYIVLFILFFSWIIPHITSVNFINDFKKYNFINMIVLYAIRVM